MRGTASLVLSYRIERGTSPKELEAMEMTSAKRLSIQHLSGVGAPPPSRAQPLRQHRPRLPRPLHRLLLLRRRDDLGSYADRMRYGDDRGNCDRYRDPNCKRDAHRNHSLDRG